MSDETRVHWTEDDDLLSRYVLDRLPAEERPRLERHLQSCQSCSDAVQRERDLASGIRQFGREELRSRLRNRLASTGGTHGWSFPPWQRVLSAAAVVLIIAGIGIYNHWFSRNALQRPLTNEELQKTSVSDSGVSTVPPQSNEGQDLAAGRSVADKKTHDVIARQEPALAQQNRPSLEVTGVQADQQAALRQQEHELALPSAAAGGNALQGKDQGFQNNRVAISQSGLTQFWVEGGFVREAEKGAHGKKAAPKEISAAESQRKADSRFDKSGMGRSGKYELGPGEIELAQLNQRALPPQQQLVQMNRPGSVQAEVEQTGHMTKLTLFLDPLLDENDLKSARVGRIGDDSLVIMAGSRTLGFRMPPGFFESLTVRQILK